MKKESALCCALSYVIIGIVWFFLDKNMHKNPLVKFHVKQGLVFLLFSLIWAAALDVCKTVLGWIPLFNATFLLLGYVPVVFLIIGLINGLNMNKKKLPLIGKAAHVFTF
ncbi:MAG: hypothetical protein V1725_04845 [archaeon]